MWCKPWCKQSISSVKSDFLVAQQQSVKITTDVSNPMNLLAAW